MPKAATQARATGSKALAHPVPGWLASRAFAAQREPAGGPLEADQGKATSIAAGPAFSFGKLALQAKLTVSRSDDLLEHEADEVAERVMRMPAPELSLAPAPTQPAPTQLNRQCAACEQKVPAQTLQAKPADICEASASEAPGIVGEVLHSPGQPLDEPTRAFFEPRSGRSFSDVRIHNDAGAAASARAVNALAYTVGNDLVFSEGRYTPSTNAGRRLLGHELAHAIQQDAARGFLATAQRIRVPAAHGGLVQRQQEEAPAPTGAPGAAPTLAPARPGRIIAERAAPDGQMIDIEIGSAVERLGLEQTLPSATEVSLEGWQRAHQIGPGLGVESGEGIRYAPPEVNLQYQNAGIERFVREFNAEKDADVRLYLRTLTKAHPNSLRLQSITYRLSAAHGESPPDGLFEIRINIQNVTDQPRVTLDPPEILGDWKEFLAPSNTLPSPGPATTGSAAPAPPSAETPAARAVSERGAAAGPSPPTPAEQLVPGAIGEPVEVPAAREGSLVDLEARGTSKAPLAAGAAEMAGTALIDISLDYAETKAALRMADIEIGETAIELNQYASTRDSNLLLVDYGRFLLNRKTGVLLGQGNIDAEGTKAMELRPIDKLDLKDEGKRGNAGGRIVAMEYWLSNQTGLRVVHGVDGSLRAILKEQKGWFDSLLE